MTLEPLLVLLPHLLGGFVHAQQRQFQVAFIVRVVRDQLFEGFYFLDRFLLLLSLFPTILSLLVLLVSPLDLLRNVLSALDREQLQNCPLKLKVYCWVLFEDWVLAQYVHFIVSAVLEQLLCLLRVLKLKESRPLRKSGFFVDDDLGEFELSIPSEKLVELLLFHINWQISDKYF